MKEGTDTCRELLRYIDIYMANSVRIINIRVSEGRIITGI